MLELRLAAAREGRGIAIRREASPGPKNTRGSTLTMLTRVLRSTVASAMRCAGWGRQQPLAVEAESARPEEHTEEQCGKVDVRVEDHCRERDCRGVCCGKWNVPESERVCEVRGTCSEQTLLSCMRSSR